MTHVELPALPGSMVKALAEYAASIGKRLVVEKHGNSTIYRMVQVGAP